MKQRPIVSKGLPQTVSDGVVCLRKIHSLLYNALIISIDKFLQRGGILEKNNRKNKIKSL